MRRPAFLRVLGAVSALALVCGPSAWAGGPGDLGDPPPPPPPPPPSEEEDPPPPPPPDPDPAPPEVWDWYGTPFPADPAYRMIYPDPATRDLVGLSAKGNIIIGDYTRDVDEDGNTDFEEFVLPKLRPGPDSVVQPYAIDPTDAALGYLDYADPQTGLPTFSGDYDRNDGGQKWDGAQWVEGSTRKFYESSLTDEQFHALTCCMWDHGIDQMYRPDWSTSIDAVLFTNHAVAGAVPAANLYITGALVARDDALIFNDSLYINHDIRLLDEDNAIVLPVSLKRPELVSWEEVP